MTAQIGILNRKAIALATDSAVTIGIEGKEKAFNTAEKLYELIKNKPIGIMIYNNADLIGVPWEIIIKDYRKERKEASFSKLEDYCNDFFMYLSEIIYLKNAYKDTTIMRIANFHLSEIYQITNELIDEKTKERTIDAKEVKEIIIEAVTIYEELIEQEGIYPDFQDLIDSNYLDKYDEKISYLINSSISKKVKVSEKEHERILSILKKAILSNKLSDDYTGIVITGYGEEDIFPRLYEYKVEMLLNGKIKKDVIEPIIISTTESDEYSRAAIRTFAQAEMAQTYITGINPRIKHKLRIELKNFFENLPSMYQFMLEYKKEEKILSNTEFHKLRLSDEQNNHLEELAEVVNASIEDNINNMIQEDYISPFIGIVDSLDKQQLGELAENLVNLTSFKRKMSIDTETVGGPIDVAIISKGEGFIWIKRKYYFDSKLNPYYLSR